MVLTTPPPLLKGQKVKVFIGDCWIDGYIGHLRWKKYPTEINSYEILDVHGQFIQWARPHRVEVPTTELILERHGLPFTMIEVPDKPASMQLPVPEPIFRDGDRVKTGGLPTRLRHYQRNIWGLISTMCDAYANDAGLPMQWWFKPELVPNGIGSYVAALINKGFMVYYYEIEPSPATVIVRNFRNDNASGNESAWRSDRQHPDDEDGQVLVQDE